MANATAAVKQGVVKWTDEFMIDSTETLGAETTFYQNALVGVDITGGYCKADDTQSWTLAGVVAGDQGNPVLPAGTIGDATLDLRLHRPRYIELTIASIAITDKGKKVYASDDQTGVLTNGGTYGNFIGHVVKKVATNIALVELCYDGIAGHERYGVSRTLAATGAQTIYKTDLNKTIFIPSTGAQAITLPAVADTQAGDRLTFIKTTSNAVAATLTGSGAETIDGSNTLATIDAQYDTAILVSTGAAWIVLARDIA